MATLQTTSGVSNSNCPKGQMRTNEVTPGRHYDADNPTQQWRYLNLTRNSFHILFPAKSIISYRQIITSRLYVHLKGTCSLASRVLLNNSA